MKPWTQCLILFFTLLLTLFLLDAVVFRSGIYRRVLSPESAAGQVEFVLHMEHKHVLTKPIHVLDLGDSQIAEGFSQRLAEKAAGAGGFDFSNVAIPGATMRDWFYIVRDLDPDATRYNVLAIPLSDYADLDDSEDRADRLSDLNWVVGTLRLSDVFSFPDSYRSLDRKWEVFRGTLFKGLVYRRDFREFLKSPRQRLSLVKDYGEHRAAALWSYPGNAGTLAGLRLDAAGRIEFTPGISAGAESNVRERLDINRLSRRGWQGPYRKKWLGAIFNHYRNTRAQFVIFRIPQYPLPIRSPLDHGPDAQNFVTWAKQRSGVHVWNEHFFDDLERPDYFFDGTHMNSAGRTQFSIRFAQKMSEVSGQRQ